MDTKTSAAIVDKRNAASTNAFADIAAANSYQQNEALNTAPTCVLV
ncbi:hypothetical protein ABEV55_12200 [Aneurinibacillus thermoaerophilus]|nr:hypothetical protein [Aneurinibacillus thermoaerophilus]